MILSGNSMRVVVCEDCGAKYQLDEEDDINAFECSNCTGKLKELETFSDDENSNQTAESSETSNSVLVYCTNCGLNYQIDENDNINDFECASCGSSLDFVSNRTNEVRSEEAQASQDIYYETISYDQSDEIIPIHADSTYPNDEIIPIHAESDFEESLDDYEVYGSSDDSEPIYYEDDSGEIYVDQYYEDDNQYYQTGLQGSEDLELGQLGSDEIYYSPEYPSYDGVDEIIPIHAEQRYFDSQEADSGFAYGPNGRYAEDYSDDYYEEEYYEEFDESSNQEDIPENAFVEITDIPEDELPETPIPLKRQALSEEDQKLFDRVQNEMVFDSPEEYEAFKAARYKYYVALLDVLKEEYVTSLEDDFKSHRSVKNLIKKGGETVKQSNLHASESDALVSKETVELMRSNRKYEPKKSNADILIIAGLFIAVVAIAYYYFVSQIMYVLIAFALGLVILGYGIYKKYTFNEYLARGRIIRERLLALPNDFYVFYAVQPPQSKDIINHVVVGPTGIFTILSQRYDSKDYKNKVKSEGETDAMVSGSASIQDYRQKKNTLELQTDYDDNQSRFQFGNEEIHFTQNSQIKRKALELNEDLAIFLDKKGFNGIYIEPLIGFVNDDLAILNVILTNEDLFIDELFNKVIRGRRRLDELTVAKIARLLSYYSANCDVY